MIHKSIAAALLSLTFVGSICGEAALAAETKLSRAKFLDAVQQIEKSLPLDIDRVDAITKLPLHNYSAGQMQSAKNPDGELFAVGAGLAADGARISGVDLTPNPKLLITLAEAKARFGPWSGIRAKRMEPYSGNLKPVTYYWERPWGDIDVEFAAQNNPPTLKSVLMVPYSRRKSSGLDARKTSSAGRKAATKSRSRRAN